MVSVPAEFLLVSAIVVFGFFSEFFFHRTGIPSFLFLILIGIFVGPVFGWVSSTSILPSLGIFATLTLLIVLFYGGMDTKVTALMGGGGRAFAQVLLYVVPSVLAIGVFLSIVFGWSPLLSLIYASVIGGETTAAVVIPLSRSLKLSENTVAFLTLESAMNSVLSIILFFAFVGAYNSGVSNAVLTISSIVANFSIGIVVGAVLSLGWVLLLSRWRTQRYTYVFTMGLIFLTYSATSLVGGSGELAVLIFGIVLGNYQLLNYVGKAKVDLGALQSQLQTFHGEMSFLLETLFFVTLGLTFVAVPSQILGNVAYGLALLAILVVVRYAAVNISTFRSEMRANQSSMVLMCAMGLTPATLSIIALDMNLPFAHMFLNLVTYVIIFTNVLTAIGSIYTFRKRKTPMVEFFGGLESYA
jgi:Na+:H+ antiporter